MRELFATLCLAGAIQAVLLFFVLLLKKNNRRANRYLSLFMAFLALDACELYLGARGLTGANRPYQLGVLPYSFIFGPSIFLYVALLTSHARTLPKKHLLWFAPFATALAFNIIAAFSSAAPRFPRAVLYGDMAINGGGLMFEAVLYAFSIRTLHAYIGRLKEYFSAIDSRKLSLIRMTLGLLILVVLIMFLSLAREGHIRREYKLPDIIAILASVGIGFAIAFMAMMQPEIFNRVRLMDDAAPREGAEPLPKYEKFRLSAPEEERQVKKLRDHMTEQKPYLREELTLQDLADELSLSAQHVSMLLNIHFKQSFYNFVNGYRVEEVKRQLALPEHINRTMLEIAYDAGFNSKSTFNAMFKKFTGKTPKEYRAAVSE